MTNESPTPPPPDGSDREPDDPMTPTADETSEPPTDASPPRVRRLVRDPYTRLGGVASGIGHYTGLDTSIVRILFIITTFTGGFGLLLYLLAWLVIPRADHWPPAAAPISYRNMSGRDLGIGLALVGLLIAVGFSADGAAGTILIPLALVVGGVWLLVQPPSTPIPAMADSGAAAPFVNPSGPVGAPVPPPKRRRSRWLIALAVIAALLALLMIPVLIVLGLAFGSLGETTRFTPTSVEEIPTSFTDDVGHLEIDLTRLDADDFASETGPVEISADIDLGSILVIVPDDIDVSVDSNVDFGSITVFGDSVDGFDRNSSSVRSGLDDSAADLDLRLDVDLGKIVVERP